MEKSLYSRGFVLLGEFCSELVEAESVFRTDSRQQRCDALERGDIFLIISESELCNQIADMGLFKKTDSACDLKGDVAPREFHLKIERLVMGPVKDGDIGEVDAFVEKSADPLNDKLCLFLRIERRNQIRTNIAVAGRAEFFFEFDSRFLGN